MMAKTSRARGSTEQAVAVLLCKVSSDISLSRKDRLAARLDRSASISVYLSLILSSSEILDSASESERSSSAVSRSGEDPAE